MTAQANQSSAIREYATGMPGFRLICGDHVSFPRRRTLMHADYAIKLTISGQGAPFHYRGTDHAPCACGHISVFEPFEPVVAATSRHATSFVSLLVAPDLLQTERQARGLDRDRLRAATFVDPKLARELWFMRREMLAGAALCDLQEHMTAAFALFMQPREAVSAGRGIPLGVLRSREMILDRLTDNFASHELEGESGYSRFHLTRLFSRYYGVGLHEFRLRARIALAMRLLARGYEQADVAVMVGFFDQSHFQRHFRRIVGRSPGRFMAS